jgi:hypothetical protein
MNPTYRSWYEMRARCNNPKHISYPNYGGRGITVCKRWSKFENFLADMGVRPVGTSIDRINNNGVYKPSNCQWATRKEQNNKRRQCHNIKHMGVTKTLAEWCEYLGLPYPRTYNRYVIQKLSVSKSFEKEHVTHVNRKWKFRHPSKRPIRELAESLGLKYKTVQQRMYRDGKSLAEALS